MAILKIIVILSIIIVFASCEKKSDLPQKSHSENFIVVDGIITNEMKTHKITISKVNANINDTISKITNATVKIITNDTVFLLQKDNNNDYCTDSTVKGIINKNYTLTINIDSNEYIANDIMPNVLPIPNAIWQYNAEKKLYNFSFICSYYNVNESAMYKLELDWSSVSGYINEPDKNTHATIYYYSLKTIDLGELLGPKLESVFFPKGTYVKETKYSLSPQHEAYIREMLLETQWHGGLFDAPVSNVSSNINNGLGFFGASAVLVKTFYIF